MPQSNGRNAEILGAWTMGESVPQAGKMGSSSLVIRQYWDSNSR
jgi:hypothetical protein